jgi:hypothetical protein
METPAELAKVPGVLERLQDESQEAAWRTAALQLAKLMREPLGAMMQKFLSPESYIQANAFLQSEIGLAALAGLLAAALTLMPHPKAKQMAQALRREAMAGAADQAADLLMEPLRAVIADYLSAPPPALPAPSPSAVLLPQSEPKTVENTPSSPKKEKHRPKKDVSEKIVSRL